MENEEFDYEEMWDHEEEKTREKIVKDFPRGAPRKGIKGKYLKRRRI